MPNPAQKGIFVITTSTSVLFRRIKLNRPNWTRRRRKSRFVVTRLMYFDINHLFDSAPFRKDIACYCNERYSILFFFCVQKTCLEMFRAVEKFERRVEVSFKMTKESEPCNEPNRSILMMDQHSACKSWAFSGWPDVLLFSFKRATFEIEFPFKINFFYSLQELEKKKAEVVR